MTTGDDALKEAMKHEQARIYSARQIEHREPKPTRETPTAQVTDIEKARRNRREAS